jgi:hypothetical protein
MSLVNGVFPSRLVHSAAPPAEFTGTRTLAEQFGSHAPTSSPRIERATIVKSESVVESPNAFGVCRTRIAGMGARHEDLVL